MAAPYAKRLVDCQRQKALGKSKSGGKHALTDSIPYTQQNAKKGRCATLTYPCSMYLATIGAGPLILFATHIQFNRV
jgi:hypothetical protein